MGGCGVVGFWGVGGTWRCGGCVVGESWVVRGGLDNSGMNILLNLCITKKRK